MKKFYKIITLLLLFAFLSTYSPLNETNLNLENNNNFFNIKKIIVKNNFLVKKNNVYKKLDKMYNKSIFLIKRKDIEEALKTINFLEKIEVKKRYPDTIIVKIFETRPVGILFKDKKRYLFDSSSNLISIEKDEIFEGLPNIFGEEAEKHFVSFLNKLKNNNFPIKQINKFYYFKIGRWDLELINNKTIKFPYNISGDVIKKSIELLNDNDFKNYNTIDLRVDGKIIVE